MQFELTEEHRMFQKLGKDFADREIEPVAEAIEREGQMPADMLKKLADVGLLGISAPDRYGGLETGFLTYLLAVEQMHYPCAPCSWLLAGNEFSDVVGRMGTDTQKEEFLPGIVQGRGLPGFAFGEDGVEGSTAEADVTANPQGDGWLINGARRFQVFGSAEGPVIFLAKTGSGHCSMGMRTPVSGAIRLTVTFPWVTDMEAPVGLTDAWHRDAQDRSTSDS